MSFFFYLILFYIIKFSKNSENKDNSNKYLNEKKIFQSKDTGNIKDNIFERKLQEDEYKPIRLYIHTKYLKNSFDNMVNKDNEYFQAIYEAIDKAGEILRKIIKVKPLNDPISFDYHVPGYVYEELRESFDNQSPLNYDLIILIRKKEDGDYDEDFFGFPEIIQKHTDERPIIGSVIYKYDFIKQRMRENLTTKELINLLSYAFLHEFTHILGFIEPILSSKGLLKTKVIKRIPGNDKTKTIFTGNKVKEIAISYFNCLNITGIEMDDYSISENLYHSHWDARILLGDYMISEIYYQEQVISEITLALLEDLGFYKVNYYTGGLMRYGKNKGCQFLDKDCIENKNEAVISSFPNEFCSPTSYSTCSSGRLSRGYCYAKEDDDLVDPYILRNWIYEIPLYEESYDRHGKQFTEFCPISIEAESVVGVNITNTIGTYYVGSCSIGTDKFGKQIRFFNRQTYQYSEFNNAFGETIGNNSFCALSSLLKKDNTDQRYNDYIRPTCYKMFCSEESLTIQINEEFIVCPNDGGILYINRSESNYKGYLMCPDYYLICSGTVECNNMYDCAEKESLYKAFNLTSNNSKKVFSEVTKNLGSKINQNEIVIGWELGDKGICPKFCRHCIENRQCIICNDTHIHYVGTEENDNNPIYCYESEPENGYYVTYDYRIGKSYHFKCIENCAKCRKESKEICDQCLPTHYVDNGICKERIPGCLNYDNSSLEKVNGVDAYTKCLNCKNNEKYYCVNGTKEECVFLSDYNNETYWIMESKTFPCVQRCDVKYKNCLKCNSTNCIQCKTNNYFINQNNNCVENIQNCKNQNRVVDEKECLKCDEDNGYFCVNYDISRCQYLDKNTLHLYYEDTINGNSYNIKCYIRCSDPHCIKCNAENCLECENGYFVHNGNCHKNITGCIDHIYNGKNFECNECNMNDNYYCFNKTKTECKKIDTYKPYYYLSEEDGYPCLSSCANKLTNCLTCNETNCIECTKWYIINDAGNNCLVRPFIIPDNDNCTIITHEIDKSIYEIDPYDFMDKYWFNIPYVSIVEHYIGENYTLTVFIYSECTEELLNEGYFKLNTKELQDTMIKANNIEGMKILFSVFINYNHQSHLRHYNLTSWYYDPHKVCKPCLDIDYTITNNFYEPLKEALGLSIANLVHLENLDIIDKDSDIYIDICKNVTPNGIDIPLKKRLNYLYLHKYLEQVLCITENCTMEEYSMENLTIVCKCRIGNTFEELLNSEKFEFIPYEGEKKSYNDFVDSFQIIKCAVNGFKAKNIKSNIGFFICIIFIAIQIALFIYYFLFSKPLVNVNKSIKNMSNPPKKSILKIITDWGKILGRNNLEDEDEIYVQPRDDADDQLLEEERSYENDGNIIDLSGLSIDTNVGGAIRNISTGNKLKEKADQKKVLILLSNKGKNKSKNLIEDLRSDSDIIPLPEDELNNSGNLNYGKIYWYVLSLKQHIINYFSFIDFCNITESHIPLPIKLIRSLFMIITSFVINVLWLNQTYYEKKFEYFNKEYNILYSENDISIPTGKKIGYAIGKTFAKALLSFVILLVVQLLLGIIFFSVIKSVIKIRKNKAIQDLSSKVKIKNIVFFIIVMVLMIIFLFVLGGFVGAYGGGAVDYFTAGIISLIFLEIFPFIWSLIIALFRYYGIKKKNKYLFKIALFFMF